MFNPNLNANYQNTVLPSDENLGMDHYFGQNLQVPYMQGVNNDFMPNNMTQDMPYPPLQSSTATPAFNTSTAAYAEGGMVERKPNKEKDSPYKILAQMLQSQGNGEDTILAHINPLEATLLKNIGGSGTINPKTGLVQFGLFKNPKKWLKSQVGPMLGMVLGNMMLPGLGGVIGGSLGGAAGAAVRGKNVGRAALKGALKGVALPSLASLAGSGLSSAGATGTGGYLSNYGANNAIMPALDKALGFGAGAGAAASASSAPSGFSTSYNIPSYLTPSAGSGTGVASLGSAGSSDFLGSLMGKTKDFLTEPANLLTLASVGSQIANRPKEKTPERQADEQKRLQRALQLTPDEMRNQEAYLTANEQMKRRIARNKFLPEERLGNIDPVYMRSNTPEEFAKKRKWIEYYDNPDFKGNPLRFAKGGAPLLEMLMGANSPAEPEVELIEGRTGGQDDKRPTKLRPKTFIVEASTVSDLGDGNTHAGVDKIDALVSDGEVKISPEGVAKVGKGNVNRGISRLERMVKNVRKHKRSNGKFPPKAKSLEAYMRG